MHTLALCGVRSVAVAVAAELLIVCREHFLIIGLVRNAEAVLLVFCRKEVAYCDKLVTV